MHLDYFCMCPNAQWRATPYDFLFAMGVFLISSLDPWNGEWKLFFLSCQNLKVYFLLESFREASIRESVGVPVFGCTIGQILSFPFERERVWFWQRGGWSNVNCASCPSCIGPVTSGYLSNSRIIRPVLLLQLAARCSDNLPYFMILILFGLTV